ncbi:hypothetical protein [Bacillus pinisoli]|uniref:hypothetical protein n=1 Tax=Bacillus pinisoli TaxID=2901866 RepID=UPI001FF444D1|nr:hypothetical protein [Bacillus pinisoli]
MRIKLLLFWCIILLLAGCSNVKTTQDQNGANLMSYDGGIDGFYERDLDDDGAFPNNQSSTNYIELTEDRPTIGTDQDKIREVVDTFDGVTPGSVFINGNKAYVTVHSTDSYSEKERDKLRHKLLHDITKAVPRYQILVRVHDGDGE